MKKFALLTSVCAIGLIAYAQEEESTAENSESKPKKVETIKIVDGDTIMHDIRIVEFDGERGKRMCHRIRHHRMEDEVDEELDSIMKEVDVYMEMHDGQKRRFVKKVIIDSEDGDEILDQIEADEDIVIEIENDDHNMRVKTVKIKKGDLEEVTTVEIDRGPNPKHRREIRHERMGHGSAHGLHVFPNPSSDELNIEFEVEEGSDADLVVTGVDGKELFSQTYKKAGKYKETIKSKDGEEGVYVVRFTQGDNVQTEKIILN